MVRWINGSRIIQVNDSIVTDGKFFQQTGMTTKKSERRWKSTLDSKRPSIISCKTVIGLGAPNKEGTAATHGAPLGVEEIAEARKKLDWPHPEFVIPEAIKQAWNSTKEGFAAESAWKEKLVAYEEEYPELAMELVRRIKGQLPGHFLKKLISS